MTQARVYVLPPGESWICDRFVSEWYQHNSDISTDDPRKADVIWALADWAWNQLPYDLLKNKKVITSVHHIVPDKFGARELEDFSRRDAVTDLYHVPCGHTEAQVRQVQQSIGSTVKVISRPFWVNDRLWNSRGSRGVLKEKYLSSYDIPGTFWISSFQRDTEGHDLKSPKLEKGPDIFCDVIERFHSKNKGVKVLLGGWRRQYVMSRLRDAGITYVYFERPSIEVVRDLYAMTDLYVIGARHEGGPQSVVECAAMKIPVISTDVGLVPEILHPDVVYDASRSETIDRAYKKANEKDVLDFSQSRVSEHFLEKSFPHYRKMIEEVARG